MSDASDMYVSFLDEITRLTRNDALTFGRSGDLVIDENPFLHRLAGRLACDTGTWTLENLGSKIVLVLRGEGQVVATSVPPGQRVRLIDARWSIQFSAGPTTYEIEGWFDAPAGEDEIATTANPTQGATRGYGIVTLTTDQRRLATGLAQEFLRGGFNPSVPPNKAVATQLGWTNKAVQRKIDNLADKLTAAGVAGLKSKDGSSTEGRRERIVGHLLAERIVTADDLKHL